MAGPACPSPRSIDHKISGPLSLQLSASLILSLLILSNSAPLKTGQVPEIEDGTPSKAVKIEPDNPIYYVYIAKVLEYKSSFEFEYTKKATLKEAIRNYHKTIILEPMFADSYAQAGKLYLELNNHFQIPIKHLSNHLLLLLH